MLKTTVFQISILVFLLVSISSCVPKQDLVYLQTPEDTEITDKIFQYQRSDYRLQVNDILDVQVRSMSSEANKLFNGSTGNAGNQQMQVGVQSGGDIYYMTGYSINDSGQVDLPVIGKVSVEGLTINEAKVKIEEAVKRYFSKFFIKVQLGGIRYAALGEFTRPGKYVILQNQLTIFEAISNAGDMTDVASRSDITIIRQYPNGTRIHKINLLDQSIINSPFYFIQPNDVIYAEPLKQKTYGLGVNGAQTITTVISVISTSLALYLALARI